MTTKAEDTKKAAEKKPPKEKTFASLRRTFAAHHARPKDALVEYTNWQSKGGAGTAPGCQCEPCQEYRERAEAEEDFDE